MRGGVALGEKDLQFDFGHVGFSSCGGGGCLDLGRPRWPVTLKKVGWLVGQRGVGFGVNPIWQLKPQ